MEFFLKCSLLYKCNLLFKCRLFLLFFAHLESAEFSNLLALKRAPTNVTRYFKALAGHKDFVKVAGMLPKVDSTADEPSQVTHCAEVLMMMI